MEYSECPARPPLDQIVRCYWFLRGDLADAEPQIVVPDGRLEIILHLGEPFARIDDAGIARPQPDAIVSGQLTAPIRLASRGVSDIIGIRFRTAAAAAILGGSLNDLTNRVDPLHEHGRRLAMALRAAVARHDAVHDRVAALSATLSRFVIGTPDPIAAAAIRALDTAAAPRVGHVADALGVSARTIERKVLDAAGLAPNTLRKVMRFRRAFRLLESAPARQWGRVALTSGYYDHAHMVRDFRAFAGASPTAFFRREEELAKAIMRGPDL